MEIPDQEAPQELGDKHTYLLFFHLRCQNLTLKKGGQSFFGTFACTF